MHPNNALNDSNNHIVKSHQKFSASEKNVDYNNQDDLELYDESQFSGSQDS